MSHLPCLQLKQETWYARNAQVLFLGNHTELDYPTHFNVRFMSLASKQKLLSFDYFRQSVCSTVCSSVCLFDCLFIHLSVQLSGYPLSVRLSVHPSVCSTLFIRLPVQLSVYPSFCSSRPVGHLPHNRPSICPPYQDQRL